MPRTEPALTPGDPTIIDRISVTRRIATAADRNFRIVPSPAGHVAIDGAGMLVAAPDDRPLTAVGATFDMRMHLEYLGDIREMGTGAVRDTSPGSSQ